MSVKQSQKGTGNSSNLDEWQVTILFCQSPKLATKNVSNLFDLQDFKRSETYVSWKLDNEILVKLCWNCGNMCGSHLLYRTGIAMNLLQPVLEKKHFESHERQKVGGKA